MDRIRRAPDVTIAQNCMAEIKSFRWHTPLARVLREISKDYDRAGNAYHLHLRYENGERLELKVYAIADHWVLGEGVVSYYQEEDVVNRCAGDGERAFYSLEGVRAAWFEEI